jgi:hypothetical protein
LNGLELSAEEWRILEFHRGKSAVPSLRIEQEMLILPRNLFDSLHSLHSQGLIYFSSMAMSGSIETIVSKITEKGLRALQEKQNTEPQSNEIQNQAQGKKRVYPRARELEEKVSKLAAKYVEYQEFSKTNSSKGFFCGCCVYFSEGSDDCVLVLSKGRSLNGVDSIRIAPYATCALWTPNFDAITGNQ